MGGLVPDKYDKYAHPAAAGALTVLIVSELPKYVDALAPIVNMGMAGKIVLGAAVGLVYALLIASFVKKAL